MLTTLITLTALLPQAVDAGSPTVDTKGVITFLVSKIVPIVLGFIGLMLLLGARKQRMSDVMETLGKVIIGGGLLLGGGALVAFGGGLVNLFVH